MCRKLFWRRSLQPISRNRGITRHTLYSLLLQENTMIIATRLERNDFDSRLQVFSSADCALTISILLFLERVDTTEIERYGKIYVCRSWTNWEWYNFLQRYKRIVERVWNNHYWLKPPASFSDLDFPTDKPMRRPNIACRLEVEIVRSSSARIHRNIRVVHLSGTQLEMRSHALLLDDRDVKVIRYDDPKYIHVTAAHELGHLLPPLGHPGRNFWCQIDPNDAICYDDYSIMGKGILFDDRQAQPWLIRISAHTNTRPEDWTLLRRPEPAASLVAGWY